MGNRELTVGIGGGSVTTADLVLDLGPEHPSTHGVLRLRLSIDGDEIVAAEPIVGYMHRGAEKLFEVRDYRQIIMLANRHDWLSAFSNELGVALAVERMMGIEVPERAVWLRTLLAELNRVLNHLMFLGTQPTGKATAFAARETLQAVLEEAAGGRMHYMFNRIGGVKEEVPAGWTARVAQAVADVRRVTSKWEFNYDQIDGVGVLDAGTAAAYGVSGPVARASGLDVDLRRDEPYLAYGELADVLTVVTRSAGDARARFEVLLEQVGVSLDLAEACLDRLAPLTGPVNVRLPKVVRAPEGHTYAWTENPLGVNGYYLVSRGEKTPWRMKLRTASYANVQVLGAMLPGARLADLVTVLGSMFFVVGDIDK